MDRFARAGMSSARGESSGALPGPGARGTHVPHQGGSFSWRTDEWYLAPETLMPTKTQARAGASEHVHDPSHAARVVGSALVAPLVAGPSVLPPPGPHESPGARVAPEDAHGGHAERVPLEPPGVAGGGSTLRPGASPLGRRRKGSAPRACSAKGCSAGVLDRAQGLVVMCPAHRRVTSGVAVDTGDALMRWCYHCKKAHELSAFADSVIGLSRKLATCERGRAARRAAFAKKAADGARAAIEEGGVPGDISTHPGDTPTTRIPGDARTVPGDGVPVPVPATTKTRDASSFRPKSEAETLAAAARARARGRPKRQQDLLDANPSRSGSPLASYSHGSGSHGSGPYPGAPTGDELASLERGGAPNRLAAAPGDWPRRAFEDVAFEVSTRAAPVELIGDKHTVFEQMAGFVARSVTSDRDRNGDPPAEGRALRDHLWTSDGSGSAAAGSFSAAEDRLLDDDADAFVPPRDDDHAELTLRLERAANAVRFESANFFMDLGEVRSLLDGNDAEPTFESDISASAGYRTSDHSHEDANLSASAASRGWFDALAASMLPGSTRVICTSRAGVLDSGADRERASGDARGSQPRLPGSVPRRFPFGFCSRAHPDAEAFARSMPPGGALGRRTASVTAHPDVRVGAGWIKDGDADRPRSDSVVVAYEQIVPGDFFPPTRSSRVTPFPSYVRVSPIAALGDAIEITGLRGGERVHVFGQYAQPFSFFAPRGGRVTSVRVSPPPLRVGAAGAPDVVPGFVYVQVLAPGQPATGSAFVKVLLVDDPKMVAELHALGRGAGAFHKNVFETRDGFDGSDPGSIPGFHGAAAFERFLNDLGALLESHWRSLLYTPAGRAATRAVCSGFDNVFSARFSAIDHAGMGIQSPCPAIRGALADVAEDVDAQRRFENDSIRREDGTHETEYRTRNIRLRSGHGLLDDDLRDEHEHAFLCDSDDDDDDSRRSRDTRTRTLEDESETFVGAAAYRAAATRRRRKSSARRYFRSFESIERASRRYIETTPTRARLFLEAFARSLLPSHATKTALVAILRDDSAVARRVFSSDETVLTSAQTRASLYSHSMTFVTLFILVALFRAEDWHMSPTDFLKCYYPLSPVLFFFCVAARDARVWAWLKKRSWMTGSGGIVLDDFEASSDARDAASPRRPPVDRARRAVRHSHAFDVCMFMLLMACNGAVRSLNVAYKEYMLKSNWVTGAVVLIGNAMMYSVFSAEYAPPSKTRRDVFYMVAAATCIYAFPPHTWARVFRADAPLRAMAEQFFLYTHPNFVTSFLWFFATPCLASVFARRAFRVHVRLALFAKAGAAEGADKELFDSW